MKIIFLFILYFCSLSIHAQSTNDVIGKWKFKSINRAENLDSAYKAKILKGFGKIEFIFNKDKSYIATYKKRETGNWRFDENSKKLITKRINSSKEYTMRVISLKGNILILELKKGAEIIMERG